MSEKLSSSQWSNFWRAGYTTSFVGGFENNYDGEVLKFWHSILAAQKPTAKIVDLGTGNGAIPIIAEKYNRENNLSFNIVGVDFSTNQFALLNQSQDPDLKDIIQKLTFLTETRIESTGLPNQTIDLATSQFGFEYTDTTAAIEELNRILKKSEATFAAMIHIEGSEIVIQAEEGIQQAKMCSKSLLAENVSQLTINLMANRRNNIDSTVDKSCKNLRTSINNAIEKLLNAQPHFKDSGHIAFFITNLMSLFNRKKAGNFSIKDKLSIVQSVQSANSDYLERMLDLRSAAMTNDQISAMEERLSQKGFVIERSSKFDINGLPFCHQFVATR